MELKTNDILNVSLNVNEGSSDVKYSVTYSLNGRIYSSADITMPKGSGFLDIEEWIRQDMETFTEISDYEILYVTDNGDYQTAKIRIKALKEN